MQEVVTVDPFAPGRVRVEHLLAEGDRFRSVASSTSPDRPVVLDSLGISMAGGDELAVIEDGRRWPTTAEAFRLARSEAERADREAARAEQEAARAEQERRRADALAERLRQAGIDHPDDGRGVAAPNP